MIQIQKRLGRDAFPLIEQAYYPNHKEMVSNMWVSWRPILLWCVSDCVDRPESSHWGQSHTPSYFIVISALFYFLWKVGIKVHVFLMPANWWCVVWNAAVCGCPFSILNSTFFGYYPLLVIQINLICKTRPTRFFSIPLSLEFPNVKRQTWHGNLHKRLFLKLMLTGPRFWYINIHISPLLFSKCL